MPINYKNYDREWKKVIRPAILTRSFGYCEFCNIKNGITVIRGEYGGVDCYQDDDGFIWNAKTSEKIGGDYLGCVGNKPFTTIVLTISHLDHDVSNNDYKNLRALCQRCHLRYDVEHHQETRRKNKLKTQPQLFNQ